jgi:acyl-CoA thioesterase FadM
MSDFIATNATNATNHANAANHVTPHGVPEAAYHDSLLVRSYEVTRHGHVGLGTILRYLEHLATRASAARGFDHRWYEGHNSAWVVREMTLLLGALPSMDEELALATWISDFRRVQAFREYVVWRPQTGRLVARARARWAYIERTRGLPQRVPDELLSRFGALGEAMRVRALFRNEEPSSAAYAMALIARDYESDTQQHINNCVYGDWLAEAARNAAIGGLDVPANRMIRPRRYFIEYVRQALPGDVLRIETNLPLHASRAFASAQTIRNAASGEIVVRARAEHLLARYGESGQ